MTLALINNHSTPQPVHSKLQPNSPKNIYCHKKEKKVESISIKQITLSIAHLSLSKPTKFINCIRRHRTQIAGRGSSCEVRERSVRSKAATAIAEMTLPTFAPSSAVEDTPAALCVVAADFAIIWQPRS